MACFKIFQVFFRFPWQWVEHAYLTLLRRNFFHISQSSFAGFLPGIFRGGGAKSIVIQISFVMLIFLLFSDQISGGVSEGDKLPQGAPPAPPPPWKKARFASEAVAFISEKGISNRSCRNSSSSNLLKFLTFRILGLVLVFFCFINLVTYTASWSLIPHMITPYCKLASDLLRFQCPSLFY